MYKHDKFPIYFDTEFTGLHKNTTLISIGLVSESGMTFYAESIEYDESQVDDWIQEHVIDKLRYKESDELYNMNHQNCLTLRNDDDLYNMRIKSSNSNIRLELLKWLENESKYADKQLQMYSDCYAYDWVLFVDLLTNGGLALDVPDFIYYIPIDLSTALQVACIDPDINREEYAEAWAGDVTNKHDSLFDALSIQHCFKKLGEIFITKNK